MKQVIANGKVINQKNLAVFLQSSNIIDPFILCVVRKPTIKKNMLLKMLKKK